MMLRKSMDNLKVLAKYLKNTTKKTKKIITKNHDQNPQIYTNKAP